MGELICILAVALTSVATYVLGQRRIGGKPNLARGALAEALNEMMEWIGAFTLFLAANVVLGVVVIIAIRSFTSHFISLYVIDNLVLILLSAFQAFVFRRWWQSAE